MKNSIYIVSFIRRDKYPNEDYYYLNIEDAEYHFSLFKDDNSGLYERINLIEIDGKEIILNNIVFNRNQ